MSNKRPSTEKQRRASRENGLRAKGATSAEGKERSARNAIKHGLWARPLQAIDQGPFREERTELAEFVEAFLAELHPGECLILRQAALDVADKAWRVSRAQRYEADGYASADHASDEVCFVAVQRALAVKYRLQAQIIGQLPDTVGDEDEIADSFFDLANVVGLSDEELEWSDGADWASIRDAMCVLIDEHFGESEEAAAQAEARAAESDALADGI